MTIPIHPNTSIVKGYRGVGGKCVALSVGHGPGPPGAPRRARCPPQEWVAARGIATWTEERLESIEARLTRLEQTAGLPPAPATETLRAVLANYGPCLEDLGVRPDPDSMMPPTRPRPRRRR